jgi:hypothetical protein
MDALSRARRLLVVLLVVLAGALGVAGCGDDESDEAKVENTVTGFFDNVADGEGQAACARLTDSAVKELSAAAFLLQAPASCQEAVELTAKQLGDEEKKALKSADVSRVTVTGERATVADTDIEVDLEGQSSVFRNNDPKPIELQKSGDDWKISSLG